MGPTFFSDRSMYISKDQAKQLQKALHKIKVLDKNGWVRYDTRVVSGGWAGRVGGWGGGGAGGGGCLAEGQRRHCVWDGACLPVMPGCSQLLMTLQAAAAPPPEWTAWDLPVQRLLNLLHPIPTLMPLLLLLLLPSCRTRGGCSPCPSCFPGSTARAPTTTSSQTKARSSSSSTTHGRRMRLLATMCGPSSCGWRRMAMPTCRRW